MPRPPSPYSPVPLAHRGRSFVRFDLAGPDDRPRPAVLAQPIAGRYHIDALLTAGPSSLLLRATDQRTRHPVIVKGQRPEALPIPADLPERPRVLADEVRRLRHALQAERRLLVRLRNLGHGVPHPNDYVFDHNPGLEGQGLDDRHVEAEPYLVLERLAGDTLEAIVERGGALDEPTALALLRPVVSTLAALHEPWSPGGGHTWHCVYQDLKPANILIDAAGRPTLLDFGGCQVVVDGVPVLEGGCTPGFAAPECAGPARVLLPDADVYGLGATLHHLLTGVDPRDRLARWRGEPGGHLDPRALPATVSGGLRDLVARCLARRPSDRPATARAVAAEIDALAPTRDLAGWP